MISLIAAVSENGIIGDNNQLPWKQSADLKRFKRLTFRKPIVMGRKTWGSLPGLLDDRWHAVLTRDKYFIANQCRIYNSIEDITRMQGMDIFVIGGASIYEQFLPHADRAHITVIHASISGDTLFPVWDFNNWKIIENEYHEADEKNQYPYTFLTLDK